MKWDEIHDQSRVVVDKAIENLLAEGKEVEKKENDIVEKLRDVEYVGKKLEKRKRYSGKDAFLRLKHQMERRKRLRVAMWMASAACVAVVCVILLQWKQIEVLLPKTSTIVKQENIFPAEMKAILMRADGEQVVLGKEYRNWEEIGNVLIAADSTGLEYNRLKQTNTDTVVFNQLIVPRGGLYLLVLADGTRVWMNSESKLVYPVQFPGERREVEMEGEVCFLVAKNERQPFIVKTKGVSVEVLGTFFNVEAYPENQAITTTLVEGRVNVSDGQRHYIMSPNQQVVAGEGEFVIRDVDAAEVVRWIEGVCYFSEASLENIMDKLARWYDVEVFFASESAKEAHFSLEIERYDNIATVLSKIEKTGRVKFKINGRIITVEE